MTAWRTFTRNVQSVRDLRLIYCVQTEEQASRRPRRQTLSYERAFRRLVNGGNVELRRFSKRRRGKR